MYEPRDTKDTGHARAQARLFTLPLTLPLYSASLLCLFTLAQSITSLFSRDYLESSYFDLCDDSPKRSLYGTLSSAVATLLYTPSGMHTTARVNTCIIVQRR